MRNTGTVVHRKFTEAVELLEPGDVLVLNDTRVSALRLQGQKLTGGNVEILLLNGVGNRFEALVKPSKRLPIGTIVTIGPLNATIGERTAEDTRIVWFDDLPNLPSKLAEHGSVPLPPYISHQLSNPDRYQTVYGTRPGSAAAPTAGLHFTDQILEEFTKKGVEIANVTLHVGIDTFRPVKENDLSNHVMHGEECAVDERAADIINSATGRIIAVGTTAVRTLESFATEMRRVEPGTQRSSLFIRPPYQFKIVDGMFTNFHLPRTTMLLMISALASKDAVLSAYHIAVSSNYRFLSFGDSMLIL